MKTLVFIPLALAWGCARNEPTISQKPEASPPLAAPTPDYSDATDADIERLRKAIPTLQPDLSQDQVYSHLGLTRFVWSWRHTGKGHWYSQIMVRPGQSVFIERSMERNELRAVRFQDAEWTRP